jgi:hypothetical protein
LACINVGSCREGVNYRRPLNQAGSGGKRRFSNLGQKVQVCVITEKLNPQK